MNYIPLTQGKRTLVDDEDFKELSQHKWYIGNHGYALRKTHIGSVKDDTRREVTFLMHRVINNTPEGFLTDHINRNKLDNRRNNLRTVTSRQNILNTNIRRTNRSGYTGVCFDKRSGKWEAYISNDYKKIGLGLYRDISKAISARKEAEKVYGFV